MPFSDGAKTQDESTAIFRSARLVGVADYARIEQGRRLERVFMKKVSSDQAALRLVQYGMRLQRLFHLCGAGLEDLQQIPVTTFEAFEHLGQLSRGSPALEPKNPAHDVIGPRLIGRVEVSGFSRRFEGPDDDPGRIWAQMQDLAIQESGLRQKGPLGVFEVRPGEWRCVPISTEVLLGLSQQCA